MQRHRSLEQMLVKIGGLLINSLYYSFLYQLSSGESATPCQGQLFATVEQMDFYADIVQGPAWIHTPLPVSSLAALWLCFSVLESQMIFG